MNKRITYKEAGVDIEEGERLIKLIAPIVHNTFQKGVISEIGHFGSLFELDLSKYKKPVFVSGTDGVGTKLRIAFVCDKHDTVGIDLVAMCVNDILTLGAEPLFFLDYFATGKLQVEKAVKVIKGIAEGCKQAGCSLIGGETAEMPGFYGKDEYDLAGFVVGIVEKDKIIDGKNVKEGDIVIGIASNGLHSNGFSLIRKIFFEIHKISLDKYFIELGKTLADELLEPTIIYVKGILKLIQNNINIKAMAHITGGGIPGNLPRALPDGYKVIIKKGSWQKKPIFDLIKKLGNVSEDEMRKTFNMGIGYIIVVNENDIENSLKILEKEGYKSYVIGEVKKGDKEIIYDM